MIFEDVHWGDPTSLEVLGRAVSRVAAHRALLIVTFRPEFEPPWIGQPHVTAVALDRLTRAEIHAMVDQIAGSRPLPASPPRHRGARRWHSPVRGGDDEGGSRGGKRGAADCGQH